MQNNFQLFLLMHICLCVCISIAGVYLVYMAEKWLRLYILSCDMVGLFQSTENLDFGGHIDSLSIKKSPAY